MTNHCERFCLMTYASEDGRVREVLWNSRDGVTPFIIPSVDGIELSHVNWHGDQCEPNHVPAIGSRVFMDATIEDFIEWKARMVSEYWDAPDFEYIRGKYDGDRGKAIRGLAQDDFDSQPGQPTVAVVTPEMRHMFEKRAALAKGGEEK